MINSARGARPPDIDRTTVIEERRTDESGTGGWIGISPGGTIRETVRSAAAPIGSCLPRRSSWMNRWR